MAIEGPLRELGIHDVFQLLDLSRKTGTLSVMSALRDNEGTVLFESGKVVSASIRSNPHRLGDLLVRSGKITEADLLRARAEQDRGDKRRLGEILVALGLTTPKEVERQVRLQVEAVVFELMSWREGFFRFEEGRASELHRDATVPISTESLLMEGARRIDEWSRIADRVPNLSVIPVLSPADEAHATQLDLLPQEWQVLAMIDGEIDLRGVAATLAMSEFDVARIVYGLVSTGVVVLRQPDRSSRVLPLPEEGAVVETPADDFDPVRAFIGRGVAAVRRGDLESALLAWRTVLAEHGAHPVAAGLTDAVDAAQRLKAFLEREVIGGR